MSKNIGIKEGGLSRLFGPLRKLKTTLQAGGFCFWIPKDEITLTTKSITKNGVYNAADDGYSGYSSVTVNVATGDVVTGKGQDGNEYVVQKDGSGKLVEDKVPSTIKVTKLPNVTTYGVGAFLGFDGIEVTAYYGDGSSYGVIPFEELVFPVTQAPWEPSGDVEYESFSDLSTGGFSQPIPNAKTFHGTDGSHGEYETSKSMSGDGRLTAYYTSSDRSRCYLVLASSNPEDKFGADDNLTNNYTYNNKRFITLVGHG